jgi:uncharacterized protein RhaS with RHS repeats
MYVESDPIGLQGGSYSTYAYASGNPVTNFDSTGLLSAAVTNCVCKYMKASGYSAWQAWSAALASRKNPGPWNDPTLRPCENYLYGLSTVADYGDPVWFANLGVTGHWLLKYVPNVNTTPPTSEARDAGYEGVSDGASKRDWKKQCEHGCGH